MEEEQSITMYCTPNPCLLHVQYEGSLYCTVTLSPLLWSHWTSGLPVFAGNVLPCSSIGVRQGESDISAGMLSPLLRPSMCCSKLTGGMKDSPLK